MLEEHINPYITNAGENRDTQHGGHRDWRVPYGRTER